MQTKKLLATLKLINQREKSSNYFSDYSDYYHFCSYDNYQVFSWDTSNQGEFSFWKVMPNISSIEVVTAEEAIDFWQQQEQFYEIDRGKSFNYDKRLFLDDKSKAIRQKHYQDLLSLLQNKSQLLEAYKIKLNTYDYYGEPVDSSGFYEEEENEENLEYYKKRYANEVKFGYFRILVAKIKDDCWVAFTNSTHSRNDFPKWILTKPLKHNEFKKTVQNNQNDLPRDINALKLNLEINNILQNLPYLSLEINDYSSYSEYCKYRLYYSFSKTKEIAIDRCLYLAKTLQIRQFSNFYSVREIPQTAKFIQQKLTDIRVYDITFRYAGYTYIIGKTPQEDYLGVTIHRTYIDA